MFDAMSARDRVSPSRIHCANAIPNTVAPDSAARVAAGSPMPRARRASAAQQADLRKQLIKARIENWQGRIDDLEVQIHTGAVETSEKLTTKLDQLRSTWADTKKQWEATISTAASAGDDPGAWLTICPPVSWDMSCEDFITRLRGLPQQSGEDCSLAEVQVLSRCGKCPRCYRWGRYRSVIVPSNASAAMATVSDSVGCG